jgi:hypothetical protein
MTTLPSMRPPCLPHGGWVGIVCSASVQKVTPLSTCCERRSACSTFLLWTRLRQSTGFARTTGSDPVPRHKVAMGYRHEKDKLSVAKLTTEPSQWVRPDRIAECPVQLEAVLETVRPFGTRPDKDPAALAFEVRVVRAHIDQNLLVDGVRDRVDPDKWRPPDDELLPVLWLGRRGIRIDVGRDSGVVVPPCRSHDALARLSTKHNPGVVRCSMK